MAEKHEARIKFSIPGSMHEAGKRLEEIIRWMTEEGLTVEAYDLDNADSEQISPREQPPTETPS